MASPVDSIAQMPAWQRAVLWVFIAVFLGVVWYFLWYADAVAAREGADRALEKADTELVAMRKKLENFEEEQRKVAEMEREMRELRERLPTSAGTVDNIMATFQQQARMVGLVIQSWTPGGEEKLDFYAKLPVDVKAQGSWSDMGEFVRRVSELQKIVSVTALEMVRRGAKEQQAEGKPMLDISFKAATYRFLASDERAAPSAKQQTRRKKEGK